MKITLFSENMFKIELTKEELSIIKSCLNEACEIKNENEFYARVGTDKTRVLNLLQEMSNAYRSLK